MAALAATAVTVGVVKLVLRGSPEVRHISLVRLVPTTPAADGTPQFDAAMDSRIGLYIPRDGDQRVAVTHTTAGRVSSLTPLAIHPQFMPENKEGFLDQAKYVVDTDQFVSGKDVTVDVPYRSTLKKLQARWTGTVQEGILGSAKIIEVQDVVDPKSRKKVGSTGPIIGKLVNKTGHDLVHVYFAFRTGEIADPAQEGRPSEQVLYVPLGQGRHAGPGRGDAAGQEPHARAGWGTGSSRRPSVCRPPGRRTCAASSTPTPSAGRCSGTAGSAPAWRKCGLMIRTTGSCGRSR